MPSSRTPTPQRSRPVTEGHRWIRAKRLLPRPPPQFRVPAPDSQPRQSPTARTATAGSSRAPSSRARRQKVARITVSGSITEFTPTVADGCNDGIFGDIAQGPGGVLYVASNDPTLIRFDVTSETFQPPVQMPNTSALGGEAVTSAVGHRLRQRRGLAKHDPHRQLYLLPGQRSRRRSGRPGRQRVVHRAWRCQRRRCQQHQPDRCRHRCRHRGRDQNADHERLDDSGAPSRINSISANRFVERPSLPPRPEPAQPSVSSV